jgi:hypothetical protein
MPHPLVVLAGLLAFDALASMPRRRPSYPRVSMPKKRASKKQGEPDWHHFERTTCDALGERHVGGPGREDCEGGRFLTEVKHHTRPVGSAVVERIYDRSITVGKRGRVVSSSGFTSPAVRRAAELGVLLQHRFPRVSGR